MTMYIMEKIDCFAVEKFGELSLLFPHQAWAKRKIRICKSWILHACNFTRKEYKIDRFSESIDDVMSNEVEGASKLKKFLIYNTTLQWSHCTFESSERTYYFGEVSGIGVDTLPENIWKYIRRNFPRYITLNLNKQNFDLYEAGDSKNKKLMYLDKALHFLKTLKMRIVQSLPE